MGFLCVLLLCLAPLNSPPTGLSLAPGLALSLAEKPHEAPSTASDPEALLTVQAFEPIDKARETEPAGEREHGVDFIRKVPNTSKTPQERRCSNGLTWQFFWDDDTVTWEPKPQQQNISQKFMRRQDRFTPCARCQIPFCRSLLP